MHYIKCCPFSGYEIRYYRVNVMWSYLPLWWNLVFWKKLKRVQRDRDKMIKSTKAREALPLEGSTGMCCGHDPLFPSQSALPSLPIYHYCATHVPPTFSFCRKKLHFQLIFGQNFSSQDTKLLNFYSHDTSFFKETHSTDPTFGNTAHTHQKKKVDYPPRHWSCGS